MDIVDEKDDMVRKRIYFLGGDSNYVKFGPLQESLGQIALKKGLVDEDQLDEALDEIAVSQKEIGQVLVDKGWISSEDLHGIVSYQAEFKIQNCFSYTDGRFEFKEESVAQFNHDVPMYKIVPEKILFRGIKNHFSLERLEHEFEHLKEKALKLSANLDGKLDKFEFETDELNFVNNIGEGKPFGHVIGTSELGLTRSLKVLYALLITGMVEVTESKGLKSFQPDEKKTIRRKQKTIELEDYEEGEEKPFQDGDGDFASVVGDYLTNQMDSEEGTTPPEKDQKETTKDLVRYQKEKREMQAAQVSEILFKNKKDALAALMTAQGGEGAARVGELLVQSKIIDGNQLQVAFSQMRETGTSFLNALVQTDALRSEDMHDFLSDYFKVPAVSLRTLELDQEVASLLSQDLAVKYKAIPINRTGNTLVVAMADPSNIEAIDEIKFLTEYNIEVVVATEAEIKEAIDAYHDSADMLDDVMANFDDSDIEAVDLEDDFDLMEVEKTSETAPVVKLVNQILIDALNKGTSDVHFEPYESAFRVRYRIDGVLYHVLSPPFKLRNALVSRMKIMAGLDISERRLPQDGRISLRIKKKKIDFRVSTLPTLYGEKMVLRILDKESLQLDLTLLGMEDKQLEDFKWCIEQPYGMVLVTGPSGCGKTTTLYSALIELNKISDNISTAEDPVEYYLEGINQVQMHDEIGLNFAYCLRSFLRQDPDTIMVGEIRDFETAEIAVKAALTGHVVLSTVHTNDAPSTVNRLLNMGVEPFLITASLNGVASQRLVRRLCDACKEPEELDSKHLLDIGVPPDEVENFVAYQAVGCPECGDRGFKKRMGLYEVMTLKGDLAEFVLAGATPSELKHEAMRRGMRTMRQTGLAKVNQGLTTIEEITRTTMPDYITSAVEDFEDVGS